MPREHTIYAEIEGKLDLAFRPLPDPGDKVILSNISHGGHVGTRIGGTGIKYVARGTEYYTISGRTYAVGAGQFMCVSQALASEVEVKKTGGTTLGMCVFLRAPANDSFPGEALERPLIFPASCSTLGGLLERTVKNLVRPAADRPKVAAALIGTARPHLDVLLEEAVGQLASLSSLKSSTRYESLRKLGIARAYLHEVTGRPVDLVELAGAAGMSRFELLRHFRDCYGAPPAAYHRRLRLDLAKQAIDDGQLNCGEAAHRFGFANSSSFSHAYRRVFGRAPVRSLGSG